MIGPPSSNPPSARYALLATASTDDALTGVDTAGAVNSPGCHVPNTEPLSSLVPVLVTTLTTAPVARPYSALYPPVTTSISSMNSLITGVPTVPNVSPVVLMPSTKYWFSSDELPENATPTPSFCEPAVAPSAASNVRPGTGMRRR